MHGQQQQISRQSAAVNHADNEYDTHADDQVAEDEPLLMAQPAVTRIFELGQRGESTGTSPSISPMQDHDARTAGVINYGDPTGSGPNAGGNVRKAPLVSMPSVSSTTYLLDDDALGVGNFRGKRSSSWLSQPFGCIVVRNLCFPASEIWRSRKFHQYFILVFTFLCYAAYHMSRKPISIVETILHANCSMYNSSRPADVPLNDTTWCDWKPFDKDVYELYFAGLDYAFQFAYAIAMFFSGHLAERMNLRIYLCLGMVLSGIATSFFGLGQIFGIHTLPYYIVIQVIAGVFQASGWPAVVTLVGNWFGNARKGLIFGIWNSHTNIGNIFGNVFAGMFVSNDQSAYKPWAWSFILPGAIIAAMGGLVFLFVIPHPKDIGIRDDEDDAASPESSSDNNAANKVKTPAASAPQLKPPLQSHMTPAQAQNIHQSHRRSSSHPHSRSNLISTYGTETHLHNFFITSASADELNDSHSHRRRDQQQPVNAASRRSIGGFATMPEIRADSTDRVPAAAVNDSDVEADTSTSSAASVAPTTTAEGHKAVTFTEALRIPGVVEFSLCLFFAKCVSYTFLYWLPHFIKQKHPALDAGNLASVFDVGGIVGGITAGLLSDVSRMPACVSGAFLLLSMPSLYVLDLLLEMPLLPSQFWLVLILGVAGAAVNGPYALITTAVSTELGTHPCLKGNSRAVATVTAIIDGTGSLGAAIGPAMVGVLTKACGLSCVFASLTIAQAFGMLLLVRLVFHEVRHVVRSHGRRGASDATPTSLSATSSTRVSGRSNGSSTHIAND